MSLSSRIGDDIVFYERILDIWRNTSIRVAGLLPSNSQLQGRREEIHSLYHRASLLLDQLKDLGISMQVEGDRTAYKKLKASVVTKTKADAYEELMPSIRSHFCMFQTVTSEFRIAAMISDHQEEMSNWFLHMERVQVNTMNDFRSLFQRLSQSSLSSLEPTNTALDLFTRSQGSISDLDNPANLKSLAYSTSQSSASKAEKYLVPGAIWASTADQRPKWHPVKILLDSGSQVSMVSRMVLADMEYNGAYLDTPEIEAKTHTGLFKLDQSVKLKWSFDDSRITNTSIFYVISAEGGLTLGEDLIRKHKDELTVSRSLFLGRIRGRSHQARADIQQESLRLDEEALSASPLNNLTANFMTNLSLANASSSSQATAPSINVTDTNQASSSQPAAQDAVSSAATSPQAVADETETQAASAIPQSTS